MRLTKPRKCPSEDCPECPECNSCNCHCFCAFDDTSFEEQDKAEAFDRE